MSWQPLDSQGLLIVEVSWSHSHTPHSVGLLWTGDHPDLYRTTHNSHKIQITMPAGGIRTHNHRKWAAADPRLRPLGQWDQQPHGVAPWKSRASTVVFLNRRAAARYRALASITPDRERPEETTICYKISLVQLITNLNVIVYLSTCHDLYINVLILFMIMP